MPALLQKVEQCAALFTGQEICNLFLALGVLKVEGVATSTWTALCRAAALRSARFDSHALSSVLTALVRLSITPDTLLTNALSRKAAREVDNMECNTLSNVLWSLATLGIALPPEATLRFADRVLHHQRRLQPLALSNCVWALAICNSGPPLPTHTLAQLSEGITRSAPRFKPHPLAMVLWACATFEPPITDPPTGIALGDAVACSYDSFNPGLLSHLFLWLTLCVQNNISPRLLKELPQLLSYAGEQIADDKKVFPHEIATTLVALSSMKLEKGTQGQKERLAGEKKVWSDTFRFDRKICKAYSHFVLALLRRASMMDLAWQPSMSTSSVDDYTTSSIPNSTLPSPHATNPSPASTRTSASATSAFSTLSATADTNNSFAAGVLDQYARQENDEGITEDFAADMYSAVLTLEATNPTIWAGIKTQADLPVETLQRWEQAYARRSI